MHNIFGIFKPADCTQSCFCAVKLIAIPIFLLSTVTSGYVQATPTTLDNLLTLSIDELLQESITTASRYQEKIVDTPATVMIITAAEIRERGYQSLLDLLSDLPGFDVQRGVDATRYNWITVSGLSGANRLLIFRDGIRVDSPTGDTIAIGQNFPLFSAKRVEVVFGPSAAVYGADAFGGVVNIITRDDQVGLQLTSGAFNSRTYNLQTAAHLDNGFSFNIGGGFHENRLYEHTNDPARDQAVDAVGFGGVVIPAANREDYRAPIESESAFINVNYKNLELGGHYWEFKQQTSAGVRRQESLSGVDDIEISSFHNLYARYQFNLTEQLHDRVLVDYSRYEMEPETRFSNIFSNFQPAYKYLLGEKRAIENQIDYAFNNDHRISGGIGRELFEVIPRTPDLTVPYDVSKGINGQGQIYPNTDLPIQIYDLEYSNSFAYTQWFAKWNDEWSSTVGVRYDKSSRYDVSTNPRIGLVYQPSGDTVIKAMYGEGFRAPSASGESYVTFGTFNGVRDDNGNYLGSGFRVPSPDLQPEEIRAYELALLQRLPADIDLTIRTYYYDTSRLIEIEPVANPYQFIPGAILSNATARANLGAGVQKGIDLGLKGQGVFAESWGLSWWGYYSYVDGYSEINHVKRELPFIAQNKFKLGATLRYKQRYFITPKFYWIDETTSNLLASGGRVYQRAPAYTLVDLNMGIDQSPHTSWGFSIHNLFNERYSNAVFDNSAGRGYADIAQPERTWELSLSMQL